jgi:hypothetical protein
MKFHSFHLTVIVLMLLAFQASASVLFVDLNNTNPTPPYADWSTAATNIQDAVDASSDGDLVLVTDGIYQTGGELASGLTTNRVVIDKAVTVQSVNGPAVTLIQGFNDPNTPLNTNSVRCVFLTNGAVLSGFTLTNGATRSDGDANQDQSGGGVWCGTTNEVVTNCIVSGNSAAAYGGGIYQGTIEACTLPGDIAGQGGGIENGIVNNCTLTGNSSDYGGGADSSTLNNCTLVGNSAWGGGGANSSTLNNCIIFSNTATVWWNSRGGGAEISTLNNCLIYGNVSSFPGGGADNCTLNNCTVVNNSEYWYIGGGGVNSCTLNNCITYYNNPDNTPDCILNYCCDTSIAEGAGNITNDPAFVDWPDGDFHLQTNSPCINAGNNSYVTTTNDLDGNPRISGGTVDIGAYELQTVIPLSAAIQVDFTNVVAGFSSHLTGSTLYGPATTSQWDFGDGTVISNQLSVSHSWDTAGAYPVVFTVFNDANPGGVSAIVTVFVTTQSNYFVSLVSANPVPPYSSWDTATTNIQDAVNAAYAGGTILVSNGVYQTGMESVDGSTTNRVSVTEPLVIQSVNGPGVTTIDGGGVVRCVYLADGACLTGFTVTNGNTSGNGGGVLCETTNAVVTNCVLTANVTGNFGGGASGGTLDDCILSSNTAPGGSFYTGGGADSSILNNCVLTGNSAFAGGGANNSTANNCLFTGNSAFVGGGAYAGTENNCTLVGNSAWSGGGANSSTLNNCIDYYNSFASYPDSATSTFVYSCAPDAGGGVGCTTNAPLFVDLAGGDFHLQSNSPCINTGDNDYAPGKFDLDGNPRIIDGTVDMGAYEFQSPVPLQAVINPDSTNVIFGFPLHLAGYALGGLATNNLWDFGDGSAVTNQFSTSHNWATPGDYPVVFTVFNDGNPGGVSATVTVHVVTQILYYVDANGTNPVAPYASGGTAATNIQSAVDAASLVGATVVVNDGVYAPFSANSPITIQSVNGPATTLIDGGGVQRCVYLGGAAALAGFTLTNGMDTEGGGVYCESSDEVLSNCVLVGNATIDSGGGAYQGTLNNCVLSGNTATYEYAPFWGYNGSGGGAYDSVLNDCVLTNNSAYQGGGAYNSTLNDCTLNNNSAPSSYYSGGGYGAGVWSGTASNCTFNGNSAFYGGGASYASLINCILQGNTAYVGGGDYFGTLNNCTAVGNASYGGVGGGDEGGMLYNCILYYNSATYGGVNYDGSTLNYCCTTPDPGGIGNIANDPAFVDWPDGDFHLQANSPCINSGDNAYVFVTNDLDGNPRISGGTVDIGAYEFQNPASVLSYAWAQQYGLPTDGSVDYADLDGTGMNDWQKWIAGLDPANPASVLAMLPPAATNNSTGVTVSWQSVDNRMYYLQSSTNLAAQPAFSTIQTNIAGQSGTTSYTDASATNGGPYFYRVGVQ